MSSKIFENDSFNRRCVEKLAEYRDRLQRDEVSVWKQISLDLSNEWELDCGDILRWKNLSKYFKRSLVFKLSHRKFTNDQGLIDRLQYPYLRKVYVVTIRFYEKEGDEHGRRNGGNKGEIEDNKLFIKYMMDGRYDPDVVAAFRRRNRKGKRIYVNINVADSVYNLPGDVRKLLLQIEDNRKERHQRHAEPDQDERESSPLVLDGEPVAIEDGSPREKEFSARDLLERESFSVNTQEYDDIIKESLERELSPVPKRRRMSSFQSDGAEVWLGSNEILNASLSFAPEPEDPLRMTARSATPGLDRSKSAPVDSPVPDSLPTPTISKVGQSRDGGLQAMDAVTSQPPTLILASLPKDATTAEADSSQEVVRIKVEPMEQPEDSEVAAAPVSVNVRSCNSSATDDFENPTMVRNREPDSTSSDRVDQGTFDAIVPPDFFCYESSDSEDECSVTASKSSEESRTTQDKTTGAMESTTTGIGRKLSNEASPAVVQSPGSAKKAGRMTETLKRQCSSLVSPTVRSISPGQPIVRPAAFSEKSSDSEKKSSVIPSSVSEECRAIQDKSTDTVESTTMGNETHPKSETLSAVIQSAHVTYDVTKTSHCNSKSIAQGSSVVDSIQVVGTAGPVTLHVLPDEQLSKMQEQIDYACSRKSSSTENSSCLTVIDNREVDSTSLGGLDQRSIKQASIHIKDEGNSDEELIVPKDFVWSEGSSDSEEDSSVTTSKAPEESRIAKDKSLDEVKSTTMGNGRHSETLPAVVQAVHVTSDVTKASHCNSKSIVQGSSVVDSTQVVGTAGPLATHVLPDEQLSKAREQVDYASSRKSSTTENSSYATVIDNREVDNTSLNQRSIKQDSIHNKVEGNSDEEPIVPKDFVWSEGSSDSEDDSSVIASKAPEESSITQEKSHDQVESTSMSYGTQPNSEALPDIVYQESFLVQLGLAKKAVCINETIKRHGTSSVPAAVRSISLRKPAMPRIAVDIIKEPIVPQDFFSKDDSSAPDTENVNSVDPLDNNRSSNSVEAQCSLPDVQQVGTKRVALPNENIPGMLRFNNSLESVPLHCIMKKKTSLRTALADLDQNVPLSTAAAAVNEGVVGLAGREDQSMTSANGSRDQRSVQPVTSDTVDRRLMQRIDIDLSLESQSENYQIYMRDLQHINTLLKHNPVQQNYSHTATHARSEDTSNESCNSCRLLMSFSSSDTQTSRESPPLVTGPSANLLDFQSLHASIQPTIESRLRFLAVLRSLWPELFSKEGVFDDFFEMLSCLAVNLFPRLRPTDFTRVTELWSMYSAIGGQIAFGTCLSMGSQLPTGVVAIDIEKTESSITSLHLDPRDCEAVDKQNNGCSDECSTELSQHQTIETQPPGSTSPVPIIVISEESDPEDLPVRKKRHFRVHQNSPKVVSEKKMKTTTPDK